MAFRGFGDDAMKVAADQRQHTAQMAQIAASERASKRAAMVSLAGQAEGAREFDERQTLAREQMSAEQQNAEAARQAAAGEAATARAFSAEQAGLNREAAAGEAAAGRRFTAEQTDLARQDAFAKEQADNALKERQMQLNEATYNQMQQKWQQEQEVQAERASKENAATMAALRFVSETGEYAPDWMLGEINLQRGVKTGDPGSVTQILPIPGPGKEFYGWGAVELDKDGKPIQKALDPSIIYPKMAAQMSPTQVEAWHESVRNSGQTGKLAFEMQKHKNTMEIQKQISDRQAKRDEAMLAKQKLAASTSPQRLKQLSDTETELEGKIKAAKKRGEEPNPTDVKRLEGISKQLDDIAAGGGVGNEDDAGSSVGVAKGGRLVFDADGGHFDVLDTPGNRNVAKRKYGVTF